MPLRRTLVPALLATLIAPLLMASPAAADADDPITVEPVAYTASLSSSAHARDWDGSETVTIRNNGAQPLDAVWFRLWANGVTGCSDAAVTADVTAGGVASDLSVGCTALEVTLDAPIAPGASADVTMDLAIALPERNDRTGWYLGVARLGNVLPVLTVFDDEGWHLEPYYDGGESFYSLVSDWTVTLNVPASLETPATGSVESITTTGSRETRTIVATDVRDFAWEAGQFARAHARLDDGVRVNLWYPVIERQRHGPPTPGRTLSRERARTVVGGAARDVRMFSDAFGAYPYEELDVVITTFANFGGMEYPQLIMTIPTPLVVSHEIAHQWWYGIVGNDEFEDPWIDEGFAQWSMFLPFEHLRRSWPPLPFVGCSMFQWPNPDVRLSSGVDYFLDHARDYWIPYWQGACALAHVAKDLGGLQPLLDMLRTYAAEHWLGIATNDDVVGAMAQAAAAAGIEFERPTFVERWRIARPGA
jgi:hypothetical protein